MRVRVDGARDRLRAVDLGIQDRVALVGGASQGIGRAVAEVLVAEGARVVITARHAEGIAQVAQEIGAVAGMAWDSADIDGASDVLDQVAEAAGPVEILITNTGGPPANSDP